MVNDWIHSFNQITLQQRYCPLYIWGTCSSSPRSSSRINISAIINNGLQLNGGLFINYIEYTLSRDKVSCKQWAIIDEDEYIRMQVRE